eukprot:CAMPEP_0198652118 /NCGR_PEP_ID=MMETSP1467-20131203/6150_1 /TAXON_ID=1462469 /ORGANISM="unid. sp., Strain CCMP2135" /LENGTH=674 /DNA_ID=CAMNT_0044388023 /DNA_START=19 /DNA_END=2043 /DNA_ORIENTATION=+
MAKKASQRKAEDDTTEAPPPKKKKKSTSYVNVSTVTTAAVVAYMAMTARNFRTLLDPLAQIPEEYFHNARLVRPLWPENCEVSVEVAISTLPSLSVDVARNESSYAATTAVVWRSPAFRLNASAATAQTVRLELVNSDRPPPSAAASPTQKSSSSGGSLIGAFVASLLLKNANEERAPPTRVALPKKAWDVLEGNGTLYVHAAVSQDKKGTWRGLADNDARRTARLDPLPLVKYEPPPAGNPKRKLLNWGPPAPWSPALPPPGAYWAKWKPEAAVRIVAEFREMPEALSVPGMKRVSKRTPGGGRTESYLPPTYADEIGLTSDKYVTLNESLSALPLTLTFSPMSFARWQLIAKMQDGLQAQQRDFGFSDNDVDDVRRLIADTQTWLLALTLVASCLHLLFEFLAFKSDVEFWQNNKSLQGLSARSVIVDLISQIVVLAFLIDEGASLLVTVPSFLGILVQSWKVRKATGLCVDFTKRFFVATPRLNSLAARLEENDKRRRDLLLLQKKKAPDDDDDDPDDARKEIEAEAQSLKLLVTTQKVDASATFYLSVILLPLIVGWSLRSLVYDAHRGWYSWLLSSATASVYTFGFILMVPQLALNYTLKSVSHLPWKLLGFRFFNTIIDDLFAYVIKMPTMHRVSCFRDDIVFVIYLYQRWVYPVDLNRGTAAEDAAH